MSGVVFERVVRESGAATALKSLDPKVEEGELLTPPRSFRLRQDNHAALDRGLHQVLEREPRKPSTRRILPAE